MINDRLFETMLDLPKVKITSVHIGSVGSLHHSVSESGGEHALPLL